MELKRLWQHKHKAMMATASSGCSIGKVAAATAIAIKNPFLKAAIIGNDSNDQTNQATSL